MKRMDWREINFLVSVITFLILSLMYFIEGAAIPGIIVNGHFFFGRFGEYKEVSSAMYIFSAISWCLVPSYMLISLYCVEKVRKKSNTFIILFGGIFSLVIFWYFSILHIVEAINAIFTNK